MTYSLKHEKRLRGRVLGNIDKRGGKVLPIEARMLKSIDRSFAKSGITPGEVDPKRLKNWGGKNLFEKARDIGLEEAYLAVIGGASHNVHGNWQELLEYHLEENESACFGPDLDWHTPRPQILNAVALHATEAVREHFERIGGPEFADVEPSLGSLQHRILLLDRLHERYLSDRWRTEG